MKKQLAALLILALLFTCALSTMAFADGDPVDPTSVDNTQPVGDSDPQPVDNSNQQPVDNSNQQPGNAPSATPIQQNDLALSETQSGSGNPSEGSKERAGSSAPPTTAPSPTVCQHDKTAYACNGDGTHYKYCVKCGKQLEYGYCVYSAFPVDLGGAGHNQICGICGGAMFERHSDNNNNGKCDICGHDMNDLTVTDTSNGLDRSYKTGDKAAVMACALLLVIGVSAVSLKRKHSV